MRYLLVTFIQNPCLFSAILSQRYDPHFPLQHQQKDLRLALLLGDKVEQPLYVASAANEVGHVQNNCIVTW